MDDERYEIEFRPPARADLAGLRSFDQRKITAAVQQQLSYEPFTATRNRKELNDVLPGFDFDPPLWELRVGEFRVFYDGKAETRKINVRAIRHKPSGKTTAEIIV